MNPLIDSSRRSTRLTVLEDSADEVGSFLNSSPLEYSPSDARMGINRLPMMPRILYRKSHVLLRTQRASPALATL